MNYKEGLQKILDLISIAEFGIVKNDKKVIEPFQAYGMGETMIKFRGQDNVIKLFGTFDFFGKLIRRFTKRYLGQK